MSGAPIKLDRPRVWRTYIGGKLLDDFNGGKGDDGHFPEEWIMSVTEARNADNSDGSDGLSRTESGETLRSLIGGDPEKYLGKPDGDTGVLVKLIDSAERLGIQVHPDRESARTLFDSAYGKTECWYILGGREINGEPPCVYLGFKKGVTRQAWREMFEKQDIPQMLASLERFEVKAGDVILVDGGVPHAIGAGCFLCEIQEPTDYTIRVEKKTPSGFHISDMLCHQGIGFDKMFDVFHYDSLSRDEIRKKQFIEPQTINIDGGEMIRRIGYDSTPYFALDEIIAKDELTLAEEKTFSGMLVLDGEGNVGGVDVDKGDQLFLPADLKEIRIVPRGGDTLRLLRFYGPRTI